MENHKIKSFEDACIELQEDPNALPEVSHLPEHRRKAPIAQHKLGIIYDAINKIEGFVPDWTNRSQWKYYPWFDLSSGSGLSYDVYVYVGSHSLVGSRLCCGSEELAEYIGNQFKDLYEDLMIKK